MKTINKKGEGSLAPPLGKPASTRRPVLMVQSASGSFDRNSAPPILHGNSISDSTIEQDGRWLPNSLSLWQKRRWGFIKKKKLNHPLVVILISLQYKSPEYQHGAWQELNKSLLNKRVNESLAHRRYSINICSVKSIKEIITKTPS